MSDPALAGPAAAPTAEDRVLPAVAYGLYFLTFCTAFTVLLGLILAYISRDKAGPVSRSHYDFLIRTFWIGFVAVIVASVAFVLGVPLSFVLVGLPLLALSWAIFGLLVVWFAIRLVLGAIYLARREAYPRPQALLF